MKTMKQTNIFNKKNIHIFLSIFIIFSCVLFVSTTWANLMFVDTPEDVTVGVEIQEKSDNEATIRDALSDELDKNKSRAPEPTTLTLFGTGIFGIITGFIRRTYAAAKRIFDIVGAVLIMIISAPLAVFSAILVKLTSKGAIFYTQTRVGKNGDHFKIYKFRTMRVNAEKETGPVWAADNDSRLIPVGKFLRKTRLDELPQIINVLSGDMSLIGPRPERPKFVEEFKKVIPDYEKRLKVKPGITGLAQVWHTYDETINDVKKKIKYDLLYIKKMCLWTDLRIALRTVRVVLTGEGAR